MGLECFDLPGFYLIKEPGKFLAPQALFLSHYSSEQLSYLLTQVHIGEIEHARWTQEVMFHGVGGLLRHGPVKDKDEWNILHDQLLRFQIGRASCRGRV